MMWSFRNQGDKIAAINDKEDRITYLQLEDAADLLVSKIKKRCLVFSLCTNSIGSLLGYTGFINNRIVPLLLDSNIDVEFLGYLIITYKPQYLWLPDQMTGKFIEYKTIYRDFGYTLMATEFTEGFVLYEELALLLTTSGSTGSPKLVRQSYNNIKSNQESIVNYLNLDEKQRPITTLPMNYTYGLSIINSHLSVGATLLLTDRSLMEKRFWEFFKAQSATSFGGVPYTYEMLNKLRFFAMDLPSLRTMTQAGGKLAPELHKKFAQYALKSNKHFVVMYGQTEATARMAYLPYEKSLEKYGSMGVAIPGGRFSLIDLEGNEIETPDVVGELVYEGPNVTLGYALTGEDLSKSDERFGKLITGDMAKRDIEGYYYIVGRKKRFLKIFGNRVNLDEVETIIKSKFSNMECACTGVDDKMYIFISENNISNEVKHYISEKTGLNASSFAVKIIDTIPKNEAGKTLYTKLEEYCFESK